MAPDSEADAVDAVASDERPTNSAPTTGATTIRPTRPLFNKFFTFLLHWKL